MEETQKSKEILKTYLQKKVYIFLNPLVKELLLAKPENVAKFMIDWLDDYQTPSRQKAKKSSTESVQTRLQTQTSKSTAHHQRLFSASTERQKGQAFTFLQKKVDLLLEKLVTDLLITTPPDPIFYTMEWLKTKGLSLCGAVAQTQQTQSGTTIRRQQRAVSTHTGVGKPLEVSEENRVEKLTAILKNVARCIKPFSRELNGTVEGQIFRFPQIAQFRRYLDFLQQTALNTQSTRLFEQRDLAVALAEAWQRLLREEVRLANNRTIQNMRQELSVLEGMPNTDFQRILDLTLPLEECPVYTDFLSREREKVQLSDSDYKLIEIGSINADLGLNQDTALEFEVFEYCALSQKRYLALAARDRSYNNVQLRCYELPDGRAKTHAHELLKRGSYSIVKHLQKNRVPNLQSVSEKVYVQQLRSPSGRHGTTSQQARKKNFAILAFEAGNATLQDFIDGGVTLSETETMNLGRTICETLLEMHKQGVAHRDLRPKNLILVASSPSSSDNSSQNLSTTLQVVHQNSQQQTSQQTLQWKLGNFEFAAEVLLAKPRAKFDVVGAPLYMSPQLLEAYQSENILAAYDARAQDLYACGVILLRCISDFKKRNPQEYWTKLDQKENVQPSQGLDKLLYVLLHKEQSERLARFNKELLNSVFAAPSTIIFASAGVGAVIVNGGLKNTNATTSSSIEATIQQLSAKNSENVQNTLRNKISQFLVKPKTQESQIQAARANLFLEKYSTALNYYNQLRKEINVSSVESWGVLLETALCYHGNGEFENAIKVCKQALELLQPLFENSYAYALTQDQLALSLFRLKRFEEGMNIMDKAVVLREKLLGPKHVEVGEAFEQLGDLHSEFGRYQSAIELYKRTLEVLQFNYGFEHADLARVQSKLGLCCWRNSLSEQAFEYLTRAYELAEKAQGAKSEDAANVLANLASVLEGQKKFTQAIEHYERAGHVQKELFGEDSVQYARVLLSKIFTLMYMKEFTRADSEYQRLLNIYEKVFGRTHSETAILMFNMSFAAEGCKDVKRAADLCTQALKVIEGSDPQRAQRWRTRCEQLNAQRKK